MQAGMLFGRSLFGGIALFLRGRVGDEVIVIALIAVIWGNLLVLLGAGEPPAAPRDGIAPSFARTLASAARRRATWLGLLFAAASGAAFEGIGAVAGPFLVDRGLDQGTIGAFLAGPAVVAMLVGSLVGGAVSDRLGRARAASWFLGGIIAAALGLAAVAGGGSQGTLLAGLGILYLGIGCFTASSYALFMGLTDPALGATQFSAFMAATNACESWSALATGLLAQAQGYGRAFAVMAGASLLSLPLLRPLGGELRKEAASRDRIEDPTGPRPPDEPRAG
jgi:MFS family permease